MTDQEEATSVVAEEEAQLDESKNLPISCVEESSAQEADEDAKGGDDCQSASPTASSPALPASPPKEARTANHRYTREELFAIGADPALKRPPQVLEASEIYRELQESLFYDKAAAVEEDAGEIRLRPGGGRLPGVDWLPAASAAKAIPTGPPGVVQPPPRDGAPSSWKDDSWRSPFKGSPSPPIRSRLVDDALAISPPSGLPGPPGLNLRRPPMEGPPGPEWQPRDQWRRGGPPQEWRGGLEEEEPASPRRQRDARPSQDLDRWGSSKVPPRAEEAWRAAGGPGRAGPRAAEWAAGGRRVGPALPAAAAPPAGPPAGRGAPPPGFEAPPGLPPTKLAPKEGRPAPEALRNGKPVPPAADAKPRGLDGDWRAAKEKGERPDDHTRRMQDAPRNEGRPEWMLGEEPSERMSKAERQRLDFEAERLRWQEERKKGGQTAQKAANAAMEECLDDDELEQMRKEEMEAEKESKRAQAQQDSETQSSHLAEPETPPKAASGQTAQSTPVQPPPGFSPNHLFGDADEEPMDFAASLSFLDETEQDTKPKGDSGASRFARFFAMEQSPGASAEKPPAQHAPHASTAIAQSLFQDGTSAPISQAGAHALLQQLQAGGQQAHPQASFSQQQPQLGQPQQQAMQGQNQAFLFEQLAQAANNNAAAQKVLPKGAAKTLEDIEGLRGLPAMSGIPAFAQQQHHQQQPPIGGPLPNNNPGNTLLSLLQTNARGASTPQGVGQIGVGGPNMAAGQQGMMRRPSEALSQPALEPLLAAFSAQMGVGQAAGGQNMAQGMVRGNPLVQGLGQYGRQDAGGQGTIASLLAGPGNYPQNQGANANYGNHLLPQHLLQQQQGRQGVATPVPGGLTTAALQQGFGGLQQAQHQLQPNLAGLGQFNAAQQQAQPGMNEHQHHIIQLLQQQRMRDLMAAAAGGPNQAGAAEYLQRQQQAAQLQQLQQAQQLQQQHLQHLRNQQGQGVNLNQTMQLQMQLQRIQQQQQLVARQQQVAALAQQQQQQQQAPYNAAGNGLDRFFNNAAGPGMQRMPTLPNQIGQRPTALEELERQLAARR
ncbi:hypothetical protein WJX75_001723 [Coccomyxa subellipsoidea]|uniref:Uncharacterized protein n=1 Tax=Coccomyxa subellipsoidea TaxID=248742 RepID=A0ABR2YVQ0_9CHLO